MRDAGTVDYVRHENVVVRDDHVGATSWFGRDIMFISTRPVSRALAVAIAATLVAAGCSSQSDSDEQLEQQKATELVAATQDAGVAPRLTTDVAESLYGTDASTVCDAFDGGLSTSAKNLILGNPAQGRRKTVTDDAVVYGRLVVQTYCPDVLDDYEEAVADLDPFERTD
jgi:hypothetical protein